MSALEENKDLEPHLAIYEIKVGTFASDLSQYEGVRWENISWTIPLLTKMIEEVTKKKLKSRMTKHDLMDYLHLKLYYIEGELANAEKVVHDVNQGIIEDAARAPAK